MAPAPESATPDTVTSVFFNLTSALESALTETSPLVLSTLPPEISAKVLLASLIFLTPTLAEAIPPETLTFLNSNVSLFSFKPLILLLASIFVSFVVLRLPFTSATAPVFISSAELVGVYKFLTLDASSVVDLLYIFWV